jgi:hypothetical protein
MVRVLWIVMPHTDMGMGMSMEGVGMGIIIETLYFLCIVLTFKLAIFHRTLFESM